MTYEILKNTFFWYFFLGEIFLEGRGELAPPLCPTFFCKIYIFFFMFKKNDIWQVTGDKWQVTRDMWQVTRDTWRMTPHVEWTLSQNFSSIALTVWDLWCFEYLEEKAHRVNESMNDEAVCRKAPATPGLLMTEVIVEQPWLHRVCQLFKTAYTSLLYSYFL